MPRSRAINTLAGVLVLVWAGVVIASVFTHDYTALAAITPIMAVVAGYIFGAQKNGKESNGTGS